MLDKIIPKLLREYMDTDDPARRAELVQVLQDYGAFPRIFEVCDQALSAQADAAAFEPQGEPHEFKSMRPARKTRTSAGSTSDHFVANID